MEISNLTLQKIPGIDETYLAGSDGHIYSWGDPRQKRAEPKALKEQIYRNDRYFQVSLKTLDRIFITALVHVNICAAFHGEKLSSNLVASHLDGDWRNNTPSNLCWESQKDNLKRREAHGTSDKGAKNSRALLTQDQVDDVKARLAAGETHQSIADRYGVRRLFITKINLGHRYK